MGEAKQKAAAAAAAAAAQRLANGQARPSGQAQAAALLMDLASSTVLGAAMLVGRNLQLPAVADELQGVVAHLQKIRTRLLGETPKVVLAPASALPPRPG